MGKREPVQMLCGMIAECIYKFGERGQDVKTSNATILSALSTILITSVVKQGTPKDVFLGIMDVAYDKVVDAVEELEKMQKDITDSLVSK